MFPLSWVQAALISRALVKPCCVKPSVFCLYYLYAPTCLHAQAISVENYCGFKHERLESSLFSSSRGIEYWLQCLLDLWWKKPSPWFSPSAHLNSTHPGSLYSPASYVLHWTTEQM